LIAAEQRKFELNRSTRSGATYLSQPTEQDDATTELNMAGGLNHVPQ
jgi:hypothetical protein